MFRRLLRLLPSPQIEGYEHPELIDVVVRKSAAYRPTERLDVLGAMTVLDFGGGAGRHFKEAVNGAAGLRWAVVETPAMVEGAAKLATDQLRFFDSIDAASHWLGAVDLVHSNGALQYAVGPLAIVRELCGLSPHTMLWSRLFMSDRAEKVRRVSLLADNGPGRISGIGHKKVAYSHTTIPEADFIAAHVGYSIAARGADWFRFVR